MDTLCGWYLHPSVTHLGRAPQQFLEGDFGGDVPMLLLSLELHTWQILSVLGFPGPEAKLNEQLSFQFSRSTSF